MFSRQDLFARRCVLGLVQVIEQVPSRAAARMPQTLDAASAGMLLLWTILRWERTFLLVCLEELGVDMWALTRDLDDLIRHRDSFGAAADRRAAGRGARLAFSWSALDFYVAQWLDRTAQEAVKLNHPYLGTEHLLLAIIAGADPELADLVARHGIGYHRVKDAVLAALARSPASPPEQPIAATVIREGPLGAGWDTPAIGVPRRFGLGILMLMMTLFAILFAAMQVLGASPEIFIIVAVLVVGVGLGQAVLYGGKYPRAASIWVGACLLPAEILVLIVHPAAEKGSPGEMAFLLILSPLLGAGLGYLAGGLTAGVFLLIDKYQARGCSPSEPDEEDNAQKELPVR